MSSNNIFYNNTITKSELSQKVISILKMGNSDFITKVGETNHPTLGITNNQHQLNQITNIMDKLRTSGGRKDYILSRLSLTKYNKINIDIHVQLTDTGTSFYVVGSDLRYYHMYLPRINGGPKTGTNHSKWYSSDSREIMVKLAVNLRLLEVYLLGMTILDIYEKKDTGILGLEVEFDIPDIFKTDHLVMSNIISRMNPIKVKEGVFMFGKNGVKKDNVNQMIETLRYKNVLASDLLFPELITDCDLSEFYSSRFIYGISSWRNHARILVKEFRGFGIIILDPWMDGLPRIISSQLTCSPQIKIGFMSRKTKDQSSEGSCILCVLSRIFHFISVGRFTQEIANQPIPDFCAYYINILRLECL